jgi:hypothetical protein
MTANSTRGHLGPRHPTAPPLVAFLYFLKIDSVC